MSLGWRRPGKRFAHEDDDPASRYPPFTLFGSRVLDPSPSRTHVQVSILNRETLTGALRVQPVNNAQTSPPLLLRSFLGSFSTIISLNTFKSRSWSTTHLANLGPNLPSCDAALARQKPPTVHPVTPSLPSTCIPLFYVPIFPA
ncbi:hypothetical protein PM082_023136 [Marasmius tenuissimus]|nr:hypothetical protein PM082_023136 [Marasmius tenuissimus]